MAFVHRTQFGCIGQPSVKTRPTPGISGSLVDPRLVQVDVEEDEESLVSQTTIETPKAAKSVAKIHKKRKTRC